MKTLGRLATLALAITYLQLVFGGIVRITGSGMGCGDHWPKCNGSWIPPFDSPVVMIEWTHRLLATLVLLAIAALAVAAWRRRAEPGVAGRGGVMRPSLISLALVVTVALLGMVTVKLGNTALATVAHWTLAMTLVATLVATAVRAGALGGVRARAEGGTPRAFRSLSAGAALALTTVVLGGLVAKTAGAAAACPGFPLCGDTPAGIPAGASHVQMTHRVLALLLVLHVFAISVAIRRRQGESSVTRRTAGVAATLVFVQVGVAISMVMGGMPAVVRGLHQGIGVGVWVVLFLAAYLARVAATK